MNTLYFQQKSLKESLDRAEKRAASSEDFDHPFWKRVFQNLSPYPSSSSIAVSSLPTATSASTVTRNGATNTVSESVSEHIHN